MKKVIPILLGLIFLWVSLFLYASLANKSSQKALDYIPNTHNFLFKINSKNFFKSSSYSILFDSKDQDLLSKLETHLNKRVDDSGQIQNFGIDFTSDLYIFGEKILGAQRYVVIFNLLDEKVFRENFSKLLNKNQQLDVEGKTGFIVTEFSTNRTSKADLKSYLASIIKNKHLSKFVPQNDEFMSVKLNSFVVNEDYSAKEGEIKTLINDQELNLSGTIKLENPKPISSQWTLLKSGFHLETSLISPTIQDSIANYIKVLGLKTEEIQRISMNYYGMELQESEKGLIAAPVFDLLLTFKSKYKLKDVFQDLSKLENLGYSKKGNLLTAGKINYFVDSIDSKNLFIGRNINKVVKRKNNVLFEINGDATKLTTIKGGGFITSFIQVLPPFKSSKDLFNSFESLNISSKQQGELVQIKGKIKVKNERYLYNEFLKFYLGMVGEN
jgi:hypothetical protein